jgi:hypothetical protein
MGPNALFSFDYFIIMTCSCPLSKVRRLPYSHLPGLTIGLPADALLSWFLQSHLDSFILTRDSQPSTGIRPSTGIIPSGSFTVTQNSQPSIGTQPSIQLIVTNKLSAICRDLIWNKSSQQFTGIVQKLMPALNGRQLIKPPGR